MNEQELNRRLQKVFQNQVRAEVNENLKTITVYGELDDWDDVVSACVLCVSKKDGWHVVNKIHFTGGEIPPMRMPLLKDGALEGKRPDVLVIGGGIIGASVLRELMKWQVSALLVEKEADLACQASSRNDGEVHPGVDQKEMTLKLHYELLGNRMYPEVCEELGVPFQRNGQYVAFKGAWLRPLLSIVAASRRRLGVKDTRILGKKALYEAQPRLNPGYDFALYNPSAGTVCPYGLTIAYAENAVKNGAEVSLDTAVTGMEVKDGRILSVTTNRGTVYPKIVINAAGVFSDRIAEMAGDGFFSIHPRRGTEAILDKKAGKITDAIVSYKDLFESSEKNTKGGGILHTVDGNLLVGPDAVETCERENYATFPDSIEKLFMKQKKAIGALSEKDIITYFTGVRAATFEEDFIVERGRSTENIFHIAGIQSPGLTAAPAIAVDAAEKVIRLLGGAPENKGFDPVRKPIPHVRDLSDEKRAGLISENPDYGTIICRCEEISKGEILDALRSPISVPTLDGVKRRCRPGMGRCQGGFCGPNVTKIIAEFTGMPLQDVTKNGEGSELFRGGTK